MVLWQVTQFALLGMWVPFLPAAALPLWQLVQFVPLLNKLWSGLEPSQVLVDLWQLSHTVWPLWMAVVGRAVAPKLVLMWHVAHWVDTDALVWNLPGFQLA